MKRLFTMGILVGFLVLGVTVWAQQDEAQYRQWMLSIRDTNSSLGGHLEAGAAAEVAAEAKKLVELFSQVHAFWESKNVADAMKFAMDARDGFGRAAELADAGRLEEASETVTAARTCNGCHQAHRERAADGSWQIKY